MLPARCISSFEINFITYQNLPLYRQASIMLSSQNSTMTDAFLLDMHHLTNSIHPIEQRTIHRPIKGSNGSDH